MRFTKASFKDVQVYSLRDDGAGLALSDHFRLYEVACKDDTGQGRSDVVLMHPLAILLAEVLRQKTGLAITVPSGYRTWAHHLDIYEAMGEEVRKNSAHLYGMALDLSCSDQELLRKEAETLNPGGLGFYNTFIHVDIVGVNRRWDYRTEP